MGFSEKYVQSFYKIANQICDQSQHVKGEQIEVGTYLKSPHVAETVVEVVKVWVALVEKLLKQVSALDGGKSPRYEAIYNERCITYDEYYYLFTDNISEDDYLKTPAYLFTKTFTKDLKKRRFKDFEYTLESYKAYILSLDTVPSHFFLRKLQAKFPVEALFAHSYCVAKTRSGKTEFLKIIIYNLIKRKYKGTSLLILDPHGEFAREIRKMKILQKHIDDFVYLDPSIDDEHTPVFNPFQLKETGTSKLAYSTDTILDAFQQLLRDQAITGNMKRLLRHCIYALLYKDGTNMMDMLTLLSAISRNKNQKVPDFFPDEERLMNYGRNAPDPLTRKFFEYGWKEVDSRTIGAVVERIDGILSHPLVRRFVVGENTFDLEHYLNKGKIVVVNLDFTKLGNTGSEAIGRMIVSEAQNISAQRNKIPKANRPRTIIFMDECQRFVNASIERGLSEFAKFNTYLFLAHQYVEQIDDGMVKAMLSNTENKIVGRNSAASMSSISSDIGVSKPELMKVKKYQFYIKSGDRDAFLFQSSDFLLDKPNSKFYISEEDAKEQIDKYMIQKYYRSISVSDGIISSQINSNQNSDQWTKETSQRLNIHIDKSDF